MYENGEGGERQGYATMQQMQYLEAGAVSPLFGLQSVHA
jgi:hypothetical protein